MSYELADFRPSTGHLHACEWGSVTDPCTMDCAGHLYAIAQDAEQAIAQVQALCAEWEALQKGPGPTTTRIRAALVTPCRATTSTQGVQRRCQLPGDHAPGTDHQWWGTGPSVLAGVTWGPS